MLRSIMLIPFDFSPFVQVKAEKSPSLEELFCLLIYNSYTNR
jgi:hypothetical protein